MKHRDNTAVEDLIIMQAVRAMVTACRKLDEDCYKCKKYRKLCDRIYSKDIGEPSKWNFKRLYQEARKVV